MEIQFSLDEINEVAQEIVAQNPPKIILFEGEMGAGKTTLIKAFSKILGVQDATSSPTFSLVNEYQTINHQIVYHFDFYRLKKESEAYDMGIDEYLYSGNWCLIEWSEKIKNIIPPEHVVIEIKVLTNGKRQLIMN